MVALLHLLTLAIGISSLHISDASIFNTNSNLPSYLDNKALYEKLSQGISYDVIAREFITKNTSSFKYRNEDGQSFHKINSGKLLPRIRRQVFGKDNRFHVTEQYVEEFPFQSIVRLGNGCSGTLIWYKHVLTSAHCVHDRFKYYPPVEDLRIGLLRTDGTFKWMEARRVYVPNAWSKKKGILYLNHDYAVIELKHPHLRKYMPFGTYNLRESQFIQFAGYPSDKNENEMWYSYCSIMRSYKHVFLNYCDATPGMSGSGVYVYNKYDRKDQRKLVAVFSSYIRCRKYRYKNYKRKKAKYGVNVATRLTNRKVRRICKWMGAGYNCYRLNSVYPGHNRYFDTMF